MWMAYTSVPSDASERVPLAINWVNAHTGKIAEKLSIREAPFALAGLDELFTFVGRIAESLHHDSG